MGCIGVLIGGVLGTSLFVGCTSLLVGDRSVAAFLLFLISIAVYVSAALFSIATHK